MQCSIDAISLDFYILTDFLKRFLYLREQERESKHVCKPGAGVALKDFQGQEDKLRHLLCFNSIQCIALLLVMVLITFVW